MECEPIIFLGSQFGSRLQTHLDSESVTQPGTLERNVGVHRRSIPRMVWGCLGASERGGVGFREHVRGPRGMRGPPKPPRAHENRDLAFATAANVSPRTQKHNCDVHQHACEGVVFLQFFGMVFLPKREPSSRAENPQWHAKIRANRFRHPRIIRKHARNVFESHGNVVAQRNESRG